MKLKLDANGLVNRVAYYTLRAWVTYKNQSYSYRVEVMDPDSKKDHQLESLSVFSLGEKVTWTLDGKHIVGQVNAFKMTDSLFVKFRAVSSEVKKGNGWIFNCCLTDQYGCVVATGSVDVKVFSSAHGTPNLKSEKIVPIQPIHFLNPETLYSLTVFHKCQKF